LFNSTLETQTWPVPFEDFLAGAFAFLGAAFLTSFTAVSSSCPQFVTTWFFKSDCLTTSSLPQTHFAFQKRPFCFVSAFPRTVKSPNCLPVKSILFFIRNYLFLSIA